MRSTLGAVAAHLTLQFWNCSHENQKKGEHRQAAGATHSAAVLVPTFIEA